VITPEERRLRCFGHCINLGAKALIFGHDIEALESESKNIGDAAEEAEFLRWRKAGAIGKLHNLVNFIKRSSQRQDTFRKIQTETLGWDHSIIPASDVKTRWNSSFIQINDGLNCKEPIDLYIDRSLVSKDMDKKDKDKLRLCKLTEEDWEELIHLHALLYPLWLLTMKMQGNVINRPEDTPDELPNSVYGKPGEKLFSEPQNVNSANPTGEDGALFNILPAFDYILSILESAKKKYTKFPYLTTCINLAWKKFDEYYHHTDIAKVYLVASVLDPRVKLRYFESVWKREWLVGVREKLNEYMEEFVVAMKIDRSAREPSDNEMFDSQTTETMFGSWRLADEDEMEVKNEWEQYLEKGRVKDFLGFSLRGWWIAHRYEFPILSQIALELLAIPAMSTEVERVFSGSAHRNVFR
jgi:hypothetical protein